jgi:hypothetical protein
MEEKYVYMTAEQIEDRRAKVAAIEGLAELRAAQADCRNAGPDDLRDKIQKSDELRAKYPRAAAYLEAERWIYSANPVKVRLASRALEKILDGEDPEAVILEMSRAHDAFYLAQEG